MITYRVDAFEEFRRHNHSFEDVTAYIPFLAYSDFVLSGGDQPMPVSGMHVAGNFFRTLGVQPMLGRGFSSADCTEAGSFAIILSFPFWRQHFAGDRSIVGRSITLNNRSFTVVGVLSPTFDFSRVAPPLLRVSRSDLRRTRSDPGCPWHLRCDFVFGHTTDTRDRDSQGAGRVVGSGAMGCHRADASRIDPMVALRHQ
jgi:MacB-like periplasmic core domain